jgi:hypothetical protein
MEMLALLSRADKWIISILLALSIIGISYNALAYTVSDNNTAEIWVDGKLYRSVPLKAGYSEEIRIEIDDGYDVIEVDGKRIRAREADCPTQECILTGWIERAPQQIVCLPYRIVIKVISSGSAMDAIAR